MLRRDVVEAPDLQDDVNESLVRDGTPSHYPLKQILIAFG